MKYWSFLLPIVLGVLEAAAEKSIFNRMPFAMEASSESTHVCVIFWSHPNVECRGQIHDVVDAEGQMTSAVDEGTVCVDKRTNTVLECGQDGYWFEENALQLPSSITDYRPGAHHRQKRFFWFVVAAVVVIGVAVTCKILCGRGSGGGGTPNTPPDIKCPVVESVHYPPSGTSMVVTWDPPTASDAEDGDISDQIEQRSGKLSGSTFENTVHTIRYYVTDSGKLPAECSFTFEVKAVYCSDLTTPQDGGKTCPQRGLSGTRCTFHCKDGFNFIGQGETTCNQGTWSSEAPTCQRNSCGAVPTVTNGNLNCPNTLYGTDCSLSCSIGYAIKGSAMTMCLATGTWSDVGTCKDNLAPVFTKGCPGDIEDYAEARDQAKVVTWPEPEVEDNSGKDVTITSNNQSGSSFDIGRTRITMTASDPDGNSATCSFYVTINSLVCPLPDVGDARMMYNCPDGHTYGYSCSLACESGYPLEGANSILCDADTSVFPPTVFWSWPDDVLDPYCREIKCPDLPAPRNGALACDTWSNGEFCSMLCNENFDVPRNFPELLVCGQSEGKWRPHNDIPDCTVAIIPGQMKKSSMFHYFSGACADEDTQNTIKQNFLTILTNNTQFRNICGPTVPDCRAEFVSVRCGQTTRTKRHTLRHYIRKRNADSARTTITFNVMVGYNMTNNNMLEARSEAEGHLQNVSNVIADLLVSLNKDGYTVKEDSFQPGATAFVCGEGTVENYRGGTCRGCATGTFYNATTDDCMDCPMGSYTDQSFATSCTMCQAGTSTRGPKARSAEECLEFCPPGTSSTEGLTPCSPCPRGSYQNEAGMQSCIICPVGSTSKQGATAASHCVSYDLRLDVGTPVTLGHLTSNITSLSLYSWMKGGSGRDYLFISFTSPQVNKSLTLNVSDSDGLAISRVAPTTNVAPTGRWYHVILLIDDSNESMKLYINGRVIYNLTLPVLTVSAGTNITLTADATGVLLSGFNIIGRVLSPAEADSLRSSCGASIQETVLSLARDGQNVSLNSQCDDTDDCASSPCGEHSCIDEVGGFKCQCHNDYTGATCDTPPFYCVNNECQNGATCESGTSNYTCMCDSGYRGAMCQEVIVNANWGEWSDWSVCSLTCGGGNRTRMRMCDAPAPDGDGQDCVGEAREAQTCNTETCPKCKTFLLGLHHIPHCQDDNDMKRCQVTCPGDMVFEEEPLPVYECGLASGYVWNHQTENPSAKPPRCMKVVAASHYEVKHTVEYQGLSCSSSNVRNTAITLQIQVNLSDLPCLKDNKYTCTAEVSVLPCTAGKRKRETSSASVAIVINTTIGDDASLDLGIFVHNKTVTTGLANYVRTVLVAEESIQTLVNNSDSLLNLTLGGTAYQVDLDSMVTVPTVGCPPGTVTMSGICGECPVGNKGEGGACVPCEKGSYQDTPGSATCQQCPSGKTTPDVGSESQDECTGECPVGTKGEGEACVPCERGSYKDTPGSDTCQQCPSGKTTPRVGAESQDECTGTDNMVILIACTVASVVCLMAVVAICIWRYRRSQSHMRNKNRPENDEHPHYMQPELAKKKETTSN